MDLKIKDVADLLSVSEMTIERWLVEGRIPAYFIDNQYRFSRMEIEDWLLHCKLKSQEGEEDALTCKESLSQVYATRGGPQHFCLYRALHQGDFFHDIEGKTKEEVIRLATSRMALKLDLDPEVLCELLLDREAMMPTGLNHGIAVPHTRDFLCKGSLDRVFVVYPQNPLPYGSLDGQDVHTLFFLFASQDKGHLQLLAKLAHLTGQEGSLAFLKTKPAKKEFLEFVRRWEDKTSTKSL